MAGRAAARAATSVSPARLTGRGRLPSPRSRPPSQGQQFRFDTATGLSRTTIWNTLRLLAAYGLAEPSLAGWQIGMTSLEELAEQLGVTETIASIVARHRDERARYRAALGILR